MILERLVVTPFFYVCMIFISIVILTDSLSLYKYDVDVDYIEKPVNSVLLDYGTVRVRKFNRSTYAVTGYMDLLVDFSDEFRGVLELYSLSGNNYQKIFERSIKNMCTFLKDDKIVVVKVINSTSMAPAIKACPVQPQRIHFYNTKMPTDNIPVDPSFLRKGKLKVSVYLEEKLMTNASIYFEIIRINPF